MLIWKRLLVVLMGIALLPGTLGAGDFGSDQLQNLAEGGGGGGDGECGPSPISPLSVGMEEGSAGTLEATVQNMQSFRVDAYLYGRVEAGGRSILFYSPISLAGRETVTYKVAFESSISVIAGLEVCENKPGGISDAPDPILIVATRDEDDL